MPADGLAPMANGIVECTEGPPRARLRAVHVMVERFRRDGGAGQPQMLRMEGVSCREAGERVGRQRLWGSASHTGRTAVESRITFREQARRQAGALTASDGATDPGRGCGIGAPITGPAPVGVRRR